MDDNSFVKEEHDIDEEIQQQDQDMVEKRKKQICRFCFAHLREKVIKKGHVDCINKHDKTCETCAPILKKNENNSKRKKENYKKSNVAHKPIEVTRTGTSLQDDKQAILKIHKALYSTN